MAYGRRDIIRSLEDVGISQGDDLFIHSNLGFFGPCTNANNARELSACFTQAISDVIGSQGTIVVPTFTYSACHGEDFDPDETPCKMGMLSEYIRCFPGSLRSHDCNFSVSAVGANASYYTSDTSQNPFGEDGFFNRFHIQNGKILCLNFDAGTTFVHYVERCLQVPYRYDKMFVSRIKKKGEWQFCQSVHYVYSQNRPQDGPCFERLHTLALHENVAKTAGLGGGCVLAESSAALYCLIENALKTRPRFLLKEEYKVE